MKNPLMTPLVFARLALTTAQEGQLPHAKNFNIGSQWDADCVGDVWILNISDIAYTLLYRWVINVETVATIRTLDTRDVPAWLIENNKEIFAPKVVDAYKQEVEALRDNLRKVARSLAAATETIDSLFINVSEMERELAKHG